MANNRRDRDKGDGSQGEGLSAGGGMPSEPEIVSVTVHPTPTLAVSLKPAQQGDIWASLLESSPWSANHGGRIEPVQPSPAPTRPTESPSVGDLVSRWSQPIWRTPSRVEEVETPESNFVIELEASQPITSDITVSVSDLVIEVQPIQTTEAEPEPELPVAEPEPGVVPVDVVAEAEPEPELPVAEPEVVPVDVVAEAEPEPELPVTEPEPEVVPVDVVAEAEPEPELPVAAPEPEVLPVEVVAEAEPEPELPVAAPEPEVLPVEVVAEAEPEPELPVAAPEPEVVPVDVVAEAEPEPELPVAEPELVHEAAVSEPVAESIEDAVAVPAPATNFGLAELMQAAAAMAPVLASPPSVAPAAKPVREPAKKRKAPPVRKKVATVQDVPVEDLLGGIFGIAGSAVRSVLSLGAGVVGGVVKGGRVIGDNVVAGARRLTGSAEGSCGTCSTSQCDTVGKKK
ncbi:magnetosome protein MamJ [Magnetospirillum sp. ME-1]|uniref:magnetosome protein MamJ n=1 Tax=Magnetospirillum sp. ME-1 TaxID=1639348 RepID=UPI00215029AE|nr:magnetosome protein MamJ [Magnetospirillum sp. ME-1]